MSIAPKELRLKIVKDLKFLSKINALESNEERAKAIENECVDCGLEVSPKVIRDVLKNLPGEELTDKELEHVVGGKVGSSGNDCMVELGGTNMHGKGGDDLMVSILGDSHLDGGDGNDTLHGGVFSSTLEGGAGDDLLYSSIDPGTLDGGEGDDKLYGNLSSDKLSGGTGDDTLDGGLGADVLHGGKGNDSLDGGWGDDLLYGGDGNDTLNGGLGNDLLNSGSGNDVMTGGEGADTFTFSAMNWGEKIITDFEPGKDTLSFPDCEPHNIVVTSNEGGTIIQFSGTEIFLQGVNMSREEVLEHSKF